MTPQPWSRKIVGVIGIGALVIAFVLWKAWGASTSQASTASAFVVPQDFHWGENAQRPTPTPAAQPTTIVKYVYAQQQTASSMATPKPSCQPCQERWSRYRAAIENGLGRDEQERTYEIPSVVNSMPGNLYSGARTATWR